MKKGFTLIELLIVIGILAILAVAAVLVLNPAEILRQARDSQRISDLSSVKSAIALYFSTVTSTPTIAAAGPFSTGMTDCAWGTGGCTVRNITTVDGNGWVPIDLRKTSGGSPLGSLPIDPSNSTTVSSTQYGFKGDTTALTFKLTTFLESVKYSPKMATDGGSNSNSTSTYEVGTNLAL